MRNDDVYATVGKRIREERTKAGLTLEELAEASSISPSFLAYIEYGKKKASLVTIKKLADGLRIPIARLFATVRQGRVFYDTKTLQKLIPILRDRTPGDREFIVRVVKDISKRLSKRATVNNR